MSHSLHATAPNLAARISPTLRRKSHAPAPSEAGSDKPAPKGLSLAAVFATKRLARRFTTRFRDGKRLDKTPEPTIKMEPSYRMEPRRRFEADRVETAIREVVDQRLAKFRYSPRLTAMMTKIMTEEIKEKVKAMRFDRYKVVCVVNIGEKRGQGLRISSRCVWDPATDTSATYSFENNSVYCTATVFGVYNE